MFSYTICNKADQEIFIKQCAALEKHIPNLEKTNLLNDVDGSQTQKYSLGNKKIIVHNSKYIGTVYIDSDIALEPFFE